jgi:hypothetical protein
MHNVSLLKLVVHIVTTELLNVEDTVSDVDVIKK